MKYIFGILLIIVSALSTSAQTVRQLVGLHPTLNTPGYIYRDTSIAVPNTINKYFTGFRTFGSLPDSVRTYFSITNTGVTGNATYTSATGVFNIPNYGGNSWNVVGNTGTSGSGILGTTNTTSLPIWTNNVLRARFDSLGGFRIFPGATPFEAFTIYRNSSTATKCVWWNVVGDEPTVTTLNATLDFKTVYNGGAQLSSLLLNSVSPSSTRAATAQAIVTGLLQAKVGIPSGTEYSYGLQVANTSGGNRLNLGITSAEDAVFALNHVGFEIAENTANYNPGSWFKTFLGSGNIMLRNKGTFTEKSPARFNVESLNQGVLFPLLTTTRKNNMVGSIILGVTTQGTGYTNGTYTAQALTGGGGSGATADITVSAGLVTRVVIVDPGTGYANSNVLSASLPAGSGFAYTLDPAVGVVGTLGKGLELIDTTVNSPQYYNGSAWANVNLSGYVAKTGTYTATDKDYTIDCTSGTFTVTLPTAVGITGRIYFITNSGAGTITIGTTSSQTFTNVVATPTTLTLAAVGAVQVQSNGANWLQLK